MSDRISMCDANSDIFNVILLRSLCCSVSDSLVREGSSSHELLGTMALLSTQLSSYLATHSPDNTHLFEVMQTLDLDPLRVRKLIPLLRRLFVTGDAKVLSQYFASGSATPEALGLNVNPHLSIARRYFSVYARTSQKWLTWVESPLPRVEIVNIVQHVWYRMCPGVPFSWRFHSDYLSMGRCDLNLLSIDEDVASCVAFLDSFPWSFNVPSIPAGWDCKEQCRQYRPCGNRPCPNRYFFLGPPDDCSVFIYSGYLNARGGSDHLLLQPLK